MGRTQPSRGDARNASERKDARAKHAKQTINKVVPALLASDARARKGVDGAELIVHGAASQGGKVVKHVRAADDEVERGGRAGRGGRGPNRRRKRIDDGGVGGELPAKDVERNKAMKQHANGAHARSGVNSSASSSSLQNPSFAIRVIQMDTITAARYLLHPTKPSKRNITILNMASPLRPGGGVLTGAVSQEETLCLRTTLYPSLKEEWYRLPELGGIWTPDVLVFRDGEGRDLARGERWYVDVVSAGMTRFPDVVEDEGGEGERLGGGDKLDGSKDEGRDSTGEHDEDEIHSEDEEEGETGSEADPGRTVRRRLRYASNKDRRLAVAKMTAVLDIAKAKGTTKIVLGAWGCGAYGNPVSEIARAWKEALDTDFEDGSARWSNLKEVVFAIKERRVAEEFARVLESEVQVPEVVEEASQEEDVEQVRERELRQQVQDLERQIEQTRFPELRERLQKVLADLQ